jgi:hypothetical protein
MGKMCCPRAFEWDGGRQGGGGEFRDFSGSAWYELTKYFLENKAVLLSGFVVQRTFELLVNYRDTLFQSLTEVCELY